MLLIFTDSLLKAPLSLQFTWQACPLVWTPTNNAPVANMHQERSTGKYKRYNRFLDSRMGRARERLRPT